MNKKHMPKKIKEKECKVHIAIHLRDYGHFGESERYCVAAKCITHKSCWMAVTDDFDVAKNLAHSFPLVYGGYITGKEAFPVLPECLFSKIPHA